MLGAACGWPLLAVVGLCWLLTRSLLFLVVFVTPAVVADFAASNDKTKYSYSDKEQAQ